MGAITPRSTTLQRPLDSYQEEDLTLLRERLVLKRHRKLFFKVWFQCEFTFLYKLIGGERH